MSRLVACAVALIVFAAFGNSRASGDTANVVEPLNQFLSEQSKLLGFRYSDEHFNDGKAPYDAINLATDFSPVPRGRFTSIAIVIATIRKAVPTVDVTLDSVHGDVIHVSDKRLKNISGYVIASALKGFSYAGDLPHLPAAIGKSLKVHIVCANIATGDSLGCAGFNSSISVPCTDSSVISVLTTAAYQFRQLRGNIWSSMTQRDENGMLVTYVAFH